MRGKKALLRGLLGSGWRLQLASAMVERVAPDLSIMAYHRVVDQDQDGTYGDIELISASPQQFAKQVEWIANNRSPLTFARLGELLDNNQPLPPRPIIVTFDDGFADNYTNAFPILREHGVPATFFVSTGYIGQPQTFWFEWVALQCLDPDRDSLEIESVGIQTDLPNDPAGRRRVCADALERIKRAPRQIHLDAMAELKQSATGRKPGISDTMNWDQVRTMRDAGMEFGSHGVEHSMLAKLDDTELAAELSQSKAELERELDQPVLSISYPVGGKDAADRRVEQAAEAAGYRFGCNYLPGGNRISSMAPLGLNRAHVERYMDLDWYAAAAAFPSLS